MTNMKVNPVRQARPGSTGHSTPIFHCHPLTPLALALLAAVGRTAAMGSCKFHMSGAHTRPNDPNALFLWKGQWVRIHEQKYAATKAPDNVSPCLSRSHRPKLRRLE